MAIAQTPVPPALEQRSRIHYLDNLRAIAMLLGVYLHAALAYAEPNRNVWLATNPTGSRSIDVSILFIHLFRMSLFFLIAGYFAKMMFVKKGTARFLWGRVLRIVVPFVLFYPCLLFATFLVIAFAVSYVEHPEGLLGLIVEKDGKPAQERRLPKIGTMHFWFLYYLMMFVIVGLILGPLTQKFSAWAQKRNWLAKWKSDHLIFVCLFVAPALLIPSCLEAGSPMPAPESFVPAWWPFAFFGLFYAAGSGLYGHERLLDRLQTWTPFLVLASITVFVPYYWTLPILKIEMQDLGSIRVFGSSSLLSSAVTAYLGVWLTVLSLLVGQRFLTKQSGFLRLMSDSAYWVYLLHLPIVVFWQTLLIPWPLPIWLKLLFVVVATWLPCMATYLVFVRYTPLGWLLHGKRSFP